MLVQRQAQFPWIATIKDAVFAILDIQAQTAMLVVLASMDTRIVRNAIATSTDQAVKIVMNLDNANANWVSLA